MKVCASETAFFFFAKRMYPESSWDAHVQVIYCHERLILLHSAVNYFSCRKFSRVVVVTCFFETRLVCAGEHALARDRRNTVFSSALCLSLEFVLIVRAHVPPRMRTNASKPNAFKRNDLTRWEATPPIPLNSVHNHTLDCVYPSSA